MKPKRTKLGETLAEIDESLLADTRFIRLRSTVFSHGRLLRLRRWRRALATVIRRETKK